MSYVLSLKLQDTDVSQHTCVYSGVFRLSDETHQQSAPFTCPYLSNRAIQLAKSIFASISLFS